MESIRFIIQFFFKVAVAFFFGALVWWLVALLFPALSFTALTASFKNSDGTAKDWLPAPRNYSGLFRANTPGTNGTVYVHGEAYNGYSGETSDYTYSKVAYPTYDANGKEIVEVEKQQATEDAVPVPAQTQTSQPQAINNAQLAKSLYIRNLSIYESGSIYTGLTFVGEARSEFFNEGKFPIVVINKDGTIVGVSAALATTKWTIPGWVRFETKIIYALPKNAPCTMIFEEALTQSELNRKPVRVPLNINCN